MYPVMRRSSQDLVCCARLTYLGTLKLDVISRLENGHFNSTDDTYELADIIVKLGGTATNFASAARGLFTKVSIIAANGNDPLADVLGTQLAALCDEVLLEKCQDVASAVVVNLRDAPDEAGLTRRILLSSRFSPHMTLSSDHVRACAETIRGSDVLIVDGYSLQHDTSRAALIAALEIAKESDVGTIFDLVPHNLPVTMSSDTVIPALRKADIVIAEARTVIGLSKATWPVVAADEDELVTLAREAANRLNRSATWILRYGFENMEDALIMRGNTIFARYRTDYRHASQKAGFGDAQLVHELRTMLLDERGKLRPLG
jgi:sugar/nucleoside kinase (ribokinase family)